eukprot:680128-Amphidinium_carterae.2
MVKKLSSSMIHGLYIVHDGMVVPVKVVVVGSVVVACNLSDVVTCGVGVVAREMYCGYDEQQGQLIEDVVPAGVPRAMLSRTMGEVGGGYGCVCVDDALVEQVLWRRPNV